jgi:hypothetical protein
MTTPTLKDILKNYYPAYEELCKNPREVSFAHIIAHTWPIAESKSERGEIKEAQEYIDALEKYVLILDACEDIREDHLNRDNYPHGAKNPGAKNYILQLYEQRIKSS